MPISNTSGFLPPYLQTVANRRFLSSTLDLLVNSPELTRFNGYIGRQFYNGGALPGNYLPETTPTRQQYQLEAAYVTRDSNQNITNITNFTDVLNSCANKEAITPAWNRLLSSNMFSWKGFMDLDKVINYFDYCWLSISTNAWYWTNSIAIVPRGTVATDIIGQVFYTDTTGIALLDGMIVSFPNETSAPYNSGAWLVEGVGLSIALVSVKNIIQPIFSVDQNNPPDYLTVAREAADKNLWSRTNLWVSKNTINSIINILQQQNVIFTPPTTFIFAQRPIIEFEPLALFGFGKIGLDAVTYFDNFTPDAFYTVQGQPYFGVDGFQLNSGDTVIFNADQHLNIRNTVYNVNFVNPAISPQIPRLYPVQAVATSNISLSGLATIDDYICQTGDRILAIGQTIGSTNGIYIASPSGWSLSSDWAVNEPTPVGVLVLYGTTNAKKYFTHTISTGWAVATSPTIQLTAKTIASARNCALILSGTTNADLTTVYDGNSWKISPQNKTAINQAPLFDVFDLNGNSFGNTTAYPNSSFMGSKLFSYELGTGQNDIILGFPLTYGPVGNLNDVIFENNYVTDTFSYLNVTTAVAINSGRTHLVDPISLVENVYDCWQYVNSSMELYQNYVVTGQNVISFTGNLLVKNTPNSQVTQVYVDGVSLSSNEFTVVELNNKITITITTAVSSTSTVLIKIMCSGAISGAWYDVPPVFDHNPLGQNLSKFDMGSMREHALVSQENANNVSGVATLQLQEYNGVPGCILFQEAVSALPALLLTESVFDIDQALRVAAEDYTLFKQRFINVAGQLSNIQNLTTKQRVDNILQTVAQSSAIGQPWATSDMCYWGGTAQSIIVTNVTNTTFNLTQTYDWSQPNGRSLQLYVNGTQLIRDVDYSTIGSILNILITLNLNDVLVIYEILNTDGSYIPATPTKLGLAAAYLPQIYTDYTYQTPRLVLQGHDGSITTCYGDYRDALLLDYELRVYNNLKVDNQLMTDIIEYHVPSGGRWRSEQNNASIAPYTPSELLTIQQRMFYEWAADYNVNYLNTFYDSADLFTWNWSSSFDKLTDKEPLLGYWRGIYNWFYDTNNVNTRPWEMLNLSIKPVWWDTTYGVAPYTGGNGVMWADIAAGIIRDPAGIRNSTFGPRTFTGNTVLNVLPVDSSGNLLDPNSSVVGVYNTTSAAHDFIFGDGSPVETAWKRSSTYPYAKLRAQILQNPMFMLGVLWDTNNYLPTVGFDQFRYQKNYLGSVEQVVLNSVDGNGLARTNSLLNYTIEYLRRQGQNPSILRTTIDNTTVQLMYPLGGYSSVNDLSATGSPNNPNDMGAQELIPIQDYELFLNRSTPIGTLNYSGLIITSTTNGQYQITGYNRIDPYFTIYPPQIYGPSNSVGVTPNTFKYPLAFNNSTAVVPYNTTFPNIQSVINFISGYDRFLTANGVSFTVNTSQSQIDWTSAASQFVKWAITDWNTTTPLSLVLNPSASIVQYTASSGTLYDLSDPLDSLLLDTSGNAIEGKYLDVYRDGNNVTITHQGGGVFACISADIVSYEHRVVFDNTTAFNDTIYNPVTTIRQNRLIFSGQKSANWTGTLNSPGFLICTSTVPSWTPNTDYLFGSLVSWKNNNYVATQNVIGGSSFQYSQFQLISTVFTDTILPNLSLKAQDYNNAYNTNYRPFLTDLMHLRNNTIGYIERDWLSSLNIDLSAQTNFYRGWIKEKGTLNSLNSYGRGSTATFNTQVVVNEEYAIKVGVYGLDSRTGYGDISLPPSVNTTNPLIVTFVDTPNPADTCTIQVTPNNLYEKSVNWTNNFAQNYGNLKLTENTFQSAGPVVPTHFIKTATNTISGFTTADVDSLFFPTLLDMTTSGSRDSILKITENGGSFWIENNSLVAGNNHWDVLTFSAATTGICSITQTASNLTSLSLTSDIKALANNIVVIDYVDSGSNISIQGAFMVQDYYIAPYNTGNIQGYATLVINANIAQSGSNAAIIYPEPVHTGGIFIPRSLRSSSIAQSNIASTDSTHYVTNSSTGEAGYVLNSPYQNKIVGADNPNGLVITSLAYDADQQVLWSGKPTALVNSVGILVNSVGIIEVRPVIEQFSSQGTVYPSISTLVELTAQNPNTVNLGSQMAAANSFSISTANSINGPAQLYVSEFIPRALPQINQILVNSADTSNSTISSLALSNDSHWCYSVNQPIIGGAANIAVYAQQSNPSNAVLTINSSNSTAILLNANVIDAYSIQIAVTGINANTNFSTRILIPSLEYTVADQTLTGVSGNIIVCNTAAFHIGNANYATTITNLSTYYKFQGNIACPASMALASSYGADIACDATGSTIAVGAPSYSNVGGVVVFNRITENQYITATSNTIHPASAFTSVSAVYLDGILLPNGTYYTTYSGSPIIQLNTPVNAYTAITIEGFCFVQKQIITSPTSNDFQFGESVAIQNNQLLVGSPYSINSDNVHQGAAYLYALDSAFTTQKIIPVGDLTLDGIPFLINGWTVTYTSGNLTSLVTGINAVSGNSGISANVSNGNLILNVDSALQTTGIVA